MKKLFLLAGIFALTGTPVLRAQVTIGLDQAPDPSAILDLQSNGNLGLLLPRVALTDTLAAAPLAAHVKGMVVYNTTPSADGKMREGFYCDDGRRWWQVATGDGAEPWQVSGTTKAATANNQNIYQTGQVTIGSAANAEPTAMLNIVATDKGVLFPRVTLTSITDATTIPDPATGLLVFNTGTGGLAYTGYVFWNGNEWSSLTSGSLAPGTIGAITCNGVSLTPSVYEQGVPFDGTMIVPYTGSNGGVYPALTIGPVNGLTATLAAGNFNPGAGNLAFAVIGTPTVTTPETTTFSLNIGGKTCEAVIGAGDGIAPGDLVYYVTPEFSATIGSNNGNLYTSNDAVSWMSYYVNDLPVVGGKLRLDAYFYRSAVAAGPVSMNPRLVNITNGNVKFWFSAMTTVDNYNNANVVLPPGTYVNLDNGIYNGFGINNTMTNPATIPNNTKTFADGYNYEGATEVLTLDLSLDNKWYRVYYYPIVDNKDQATAAGMVRKVYLSIQRLY